MSEYTDICFIVDSIRKFDTDVHRPNTQEEKDALVKRIISHIMVTSRGRMNPAYVKTFVRSAVERWD